MAELYRGAARPEGEAPLLHYRLMHNGEHVSDYVMRDREAVIRVARVRSCATMRKGGAFILEVETPGEGWQRVERWRWNDCVRENC